MARSIRCSTRRHDARTWSVEPSRPKFAIRDRQQPVAQAPLPPTPATATTATSVTLAQTEGPFFKPCSPERIRILKRRWRGSRSNWLSFVLTRDCKPLAKSSAGFWQADGKGQYDNSRLLACTAISSPCGRALSACDERLLGAGSTAQQVALRAGGVARTRGCLCVRHVPQPVRLWTATKRTSLLALYDLSGRQRRSTSSCRQAEAAAIILALAAGEVNEEGLTRWIRDNWPKP